MSCEAEESRGDYGVENHIAPACWRGILIIRSNIFVCRHGLVPIHVFARLQVDELQAEDFRVAVVA